MEHLLHRLYGVDTPDYSPPTRTNPTPPICVCV